MKKMNWTQIASNMKNAVEKHAPEILVGFGIAGMLTSTVLAVKATPKAIKLIDEKKKEQNVEKLTVKETVKTTWKCYVPATGLALASTGCLIGSTSMSAKRNAVLATAYKLAETAHKEYREQVIKTIGEKKEELIKDKVAQQRLEDNPVQSNQIYITDKGNTLCLDVISGRYFKCDIDKIKKAANELNRRMLFENYVSVNDFYDEIGLEHTKLGDELGWRVDRGYIDLDLRSGLSPNDEPCLVIDYVVEPKYDYYKAY